MADTAKKRPGRSAIGVGLTTIVTIMVVILLTTFSVLSLVSARADLNLTKKALQSTQDYYVADTAAEQWLADLSSAIEKKAEGSITAVLDAEGSSYKPLADQSGYLVSKVFAIGSTRQLTVELAVSDEGQFAIRTWQSGPVDKGNQG